MYATRILMLAATLVLPPVSAIAQSDGCMFLLDCKTLPKDPEVRRPEPAPTPPELPPARREHTSDPCGHPHGDYIVANVPFGDADNGLLLRIAPSGAAEVKGVIPPNGVGLGIEQCQNGWCRVRYKCHVGWVGARYVADRRSSISRVVGVSSRDPEGLNIRSGPGARFGLVGSVPYNSVGLARHACQVSGDQTTWCLITAGEKSGWVAARFLEN